ncbi:MAG: metallophosphoesterase family protein [Actinobacteria bacterium]|nr:metallophosphoesterase family protein [Actinomycetota bacterium]
MTKIGITGDIHGNRTALRAVIKHGVGCDVWWCVGDLVGYGPDPNHCLEIIGSLGAFTVAGNHDLGSIGRISIESFNDDARTACEWTSGTLTQPNMDLLGKLPVKLSPAHDILLSHGGPVDPVWNYIFSSEEAGLNFISFKERLCFHGHSHVPMVFRTEKEGVNIGARADVEYIPPEWGVPVELREDSRYLINVGSVGQPRDNDPRACYVIFDPDEDMITFHRVEYSIEEVQERMAFAGLPERLIVRLAVGK